MADCSSSTAVPITPEVGETPKLPGGWPEALAGSMDKSAIDPPTLAAMRQEMKAAFDAYNVAQKAQDVLSPDEPTAAQVEAYHATMARHIAAVRAMVSYEPMSPGELLDKIDALKSVEADGADGIVDDLWGTLADDVQGVLLAQRPVKGTGAKNCPAERLLDEHEALDAATCAENESGEFGDATRRANEIEEQASWARAQTLRGAMYQLALAAGRVSTMHGETEPVQIELDFAHVGRLLISSLDLVQRLVGGPIPQVVESFSGLSYGWQDELSDAPRVFNADRFILDYVAAGGSLAVQGHGDDMALVNTYPRDPAAVTPVLAALVGPQEFRAVVNELQARRTATNNSLAMHADGKGGLGTRADAVADIERRLVETCRASDAAPDESSDAVSAEAMRLSEEVVELPCNSFTAARAKVRVALMRIMRDGGSNWADKGDTRTLEQVIAFLEGPALRSGLA